YSGNPVACAAAMVALESLASPAFLARAQAVGERMRGHLTRLQARFPETIGDLRGLGPMLAIELVKDAKGREPVPELTNAINAETLKRGLITIRAGLYGNCLRFLPPLNISDEQIDEGMTVLGEAIDAALARRA
ncbi:MAG: aminotransferase class III-fold pyridoxal phosphate-dependent enzyme, partial [Rhodocyclaceae bacterium]|nr:aminotransferase class III-fold pyridoxal phosphate-dependent enzyme [Rhodocyclaceae bacterium]